MSSSPKAGEKNKPAVRIVLVEDNAGDVYLLEKSLQHRNIVYELIRYEDGEQALRALSGDLAPHLIPDLILVDLNLPRREGFDVLTAVRKTPRLVGVPVGVLTSSDTAKDRHRTALIGIERYIHKAPTLEEFIDEVGAAVEELLTRLPG
jgi:CheY-like chemotaxis protein